MGIMVRDIGLRLRKARKEAGLKQGELAAKIGLKQGSISDLERGESKSMRGPTLLLASQVLGVREEWLLTGKGQQYAEKRSETTVGKFLTADAVKLARDWMKLDPAVQRHVAQIVQTMVKASAADTPAVADERVAKAYGTPPVKPR